MPASSGDASPGPATPSGLGDRRRPGLLWLLALLLVPVLIAAVVFAVRSGPDEQDLHRRSMEALAAAGITGAKVEFTGRDARVSIDADIDLEQVRQIVAEVDGVGTVSIDPALTAQPTPSPSATTGGGTSVPVEPFAIERTGNTIKVQAVAPDESAKQALLAAARAHLPADGQVVDEVRLDPGVGLPDLQAIGSLLATLARAKGDVAVRYDGKVVTLSGAVPDQATKATASRAAAAAVPGAVLANELDAPNVKPPREIGVCENPQIWLDRFVAQKPVLFRGGTAITTADGQLTVIRVAELLRQCGSVQIQVNGHTDNLGHPSTSLPLSTDRANAVKTQLVHLGIAATRITTKGLGHTQPIAPNDSQAGRIVNRRADFKVR
ncbi:channel-forming protein ArfA/OmpATb [Kribbella deserti]|uniref:OmpA family protein n=1 Tax=Kribbella deserti TaxID=1926257 RepID=A0ABV6QN25_9ACTN